MYCTGLCLSLFWGVCYWLELELNAFWIMLSSTVVYCINNLSWSCSVLLMNPLDLSKFLNFPECLSTPDCLFIHHRITPHVQVNRTITIDSVIINNRGVVWWTVENNWSFQIKTQWVVVLTINTWVFLLPWIYWGCTFYQSNDHHWLHDLKEEEK